MGGQQERKLISILFVDLVGFTSRSDRADPEDVRETLERYHSAAQRTIEAFGGRVEKFIGDAVMAVFGAPISHGDDAERAIRAGLEVLKIVPTLDLQARAAVNSGEAVVMLDAGTGGALALGDVVNTASRLQNAAPAGGLVAGEETHRLTRDAFDYERLPAIDAKGKQEPLEVWLAKAPLSADVQRPEAPMVGRERELALLKTAWARAQADLRPQLVTLLGPPGIGKSRLQREFSQSVQETGSQVLRGRCVPYGERAAYGAFAQIVRRSAGIFENDAPDEAHAKLRSAIENLFAESEAGETTRYLALLIGLPSDDQPLGRDFLFYAARRFFEALGARGAVLAIFEDLHWADSGLLDLLQYLATHVRDVPLMLLASARPELTDQRPNWGSGLAAHMTVLMEPLSSADSETLARQLLVGMDEKTVARLAAAAEGNPLFVEELSAARTEGRETAELPTSVRAAIAARIDALPSSSRAVLLDASVMGRHFWKGGLPAIAEHRDLDTALTILETRDFIRRVPTSRVHGDHEYLFKHALIRDVAYATLPRSIRRERHGAVARYIESAADAGDVAALLAHHWREAGDTQRAIDYMLRAADQAAMAWAVEEALSQYDAALELAADDEQKRRIRLARGITQSRVGDDEAAFAGLGTLLPELRGKQRLEALLAWTWAAQWTERADEVIAGAQDAVELAQSLGDHELEPVAIARLSEGLAMRGAEGDMDRADELGRRAIQIWIPGSQQWDFAQHLHLYGELLHWTGRFDQAEELLAKSFELAGDPQSVTARLRSASLRALVLCARGRYRDGLTLFDQTISLAAELGRPVRIIQNYSTLPLRQLFALDEARRRSQESYEASLKMPGYRMPLAMSAADLVQTAIAAGDVSEAETTWQSVWSEPEEFPRDWTRWLVRGRLAAAKAEIALLAETPATAADWARTAIELAVPVHRLKYEVVGRTTLGRALLGLNQPEAAAAELKRATQLAERLGAPAQRWPAWAALGQALYALGDDHGAESAFASAAAIIRDVAADAPEDYAATFLAAPQVQDVLKRFPEPSAKG